MCLCKVEAHVVLTTVLIKACARQVIREGSGRDILIVNSAPSTRTLAVCGEIGLKLIIVKNEVVFQLNEAKDASQGSRVVQSIAIEIIEERRVVEPGRDVLSLQLLISPSLIQ